MRLLGFVSLSMGMLNVKSRDETRFGWRGG
jgi:hypothetical protein